MARKDKQKKPQLPLDQLPIEKRLAITNFDEEDCENAIHGRLPKTFGNLVHRICIIRGIRYHYGFAQELRGLAPEFTRALNARHIMSGVIPEISSPDEMPYCIWHPEVPSEDTLRALVQKYPDMIYHAARACAVAGYIDLYKELDPLPEVHVAEEAGYQTDKKGSQEIYHHILSRPVKFSVMNDYERTVDIAGCRISPLNGDTAVCASLESRWKYSSPADPLAQTRPWVYQSYYFNITEDWCVDDHDCEAPKTPDDAFPLLYTPLPTDLPLINKDSLIHMAAYMGDVDRYTRLRRPNWLPDERGMVIRGIYHNPFFAKWWSTQVPEVPEMGSTETSIRRAINARRIMSNDLYWLTADTPNLLLPEMFWYPDFASGLTYEEIARIQPSMYRYCLQACIAADHAGSWDMLLLDPPDNVPYFQEPRKSDEPKDLKLWRISRIRVGYDIWNEAETSPNPQFLREISAAVPKKPRESANWYDYFPVYSLQHPIPAGYVRIDSPVEASSGYGPYNGKGASIGDVDFAVWIMDAVGRDAWEEAKNTHPSPYWYRHEIDELIEANKNRK